MNGYSDIEQEKENLINATSLSLKQLEKSKNKTFYFEKKGNESGPITGFPTSHTSR
jgi:hypothetical protein